jgi:hypothetical protein
MLIHIRIQMEDYYFQKGLPKSLKEKAIIEDKSTSVTYAWKYDDVKLLFEWLIREDHIVCSVFVMEMINSTLKYTKESWIYLGDRVGSFEESKNKNHFQSSEFVDNVNKKYNRDLFYRVDFESAKDWDKIRIEFFNGEINRGGELAYTAEDSLDVIDRCRQLGKKIVGIDAFIITKDFIQPQDYADYSEFMYKLSDMSHPIRTNIVVNPNDLGHWEEAKQFVKDRALKGWVFEIDYR